MSITENLLSQSPAAQETMVPSRYSIEYFHIYTDETIDTRHKEGLETLRSIARGWSFDYDKIVLIDNYNPKEHVTSANDVLSYLASEEMLPDFWAYEGDMVRNAQTLLESLPESKLRRSYEKYIASNGKYPCSLLTASWYLTRLGKLDMSVVQSTDPLRVYEPASRLFNLLPEDYKPVEDRAMQIIRKSPYTAEVDKIQHFFYPVAAGRALELF